MRNERGFSGLEIIGIIIAVALLVGAIAGAVHVVTSYLDSVRAEAFKAGADKKDAEYKGRDNEKLVEVHKQVVGLLLKNQDLERQLAGANLTIASQLRKDRENAKQAQQTVLARIDSGDLRLRNGIIEIAPCPPILGTGQGTAARPAAGGTAAGACAKFTAASERFLLGILAEGDDAIRERNACVAIAASDRRVINAK